MSSYYKYTPAAYFSAVYNTVKTILIGMRLTFGRLFYPSITLQYPFEKDTLPERSRMRLFMKYEDCIGCNQCANACPVDCITIETVKANPDEDLGITSSGRAKKLWLLQFDIDMAKCCYCALCVYPCPTECIYMTTEYEFSVYDRRNMVYSFSPFTAVTARAKLADVKQHAAELKVAKEQKTAEEVKAKAAEEPKPDVPPMPDDAAGA